MITEDDIDFEAYMHETEAQAKVKNVSVWVQQLVDALYTSDTRRRVYLPWEKTHAVFQFRPGEVTLWQGANGHGKSLVTSLVALSLIGQDERVCIASFEMKPMTTLARMARQYSRENPFDPAYEDVQAKDLLATLYQEFGEWSGRSLWLYDQQGTVTAEKVIAVARYCAKELGVTHVFIDSLMKCVKGEDDYNGQKSFVDELTSLARDNQIHVHLVHHIRKPASEDQKPGKYDGKGSGAITDLVDNVMNVWRNKPKEDDRAARGDLSNKKGEPDALLICKKQRNGEDEPTIKLWFERESMQYVEHEGAAALFFPNFPHRETP